MVIRTMFGLQADTVESTGTTVLNGAKYETGDSEYYSNLETFEDSADYRSVYTSDEDISDDEGEANEGGANEDYLRRDGPPSVYSSIVDDDLSTDDMTQNQSAWDKQESQVSKNDGRQIKQQNHKSKSGKDRPSRIAKYGNVVNNLRNDVVVVGGNTTSNTDTTYDKKHLTGSSVYYQNMYTQQSQDVSTGSQLVNHIRNNDTKIRTNLKLADGRIEELCLIHVKKMKRKQPSKKNVVNPSDVNESDLQDQGGLEKESPDPDVVEPGIPDQISVIRGDVDQSIANKSISNKSVVSMSVTNKSAAKRTQTIRVKKEKSKNDVLKNKQIIEMQTPFEEKQVDSGKNHPPESKIKSTAIAVASQSKKILKQKQEISLMEGNLEATYSEFGEPRVLRIGKYIPSTLRDGVIVRIEASTVSFTDCLLRRNMTKAFGPIALPMTPGVDCIGKVVYAGDLAKKNHNLQVGDRVCALHPFLGGNTNFLTIPAIYVNPVPASVDACQAACVVRSYLAALQVLYRAGGMQNKRLEKRHKVLVTGANGNLGRAVVELAKIAGAKVYASCRKQHKMFVRAELGADVWMSPDPNDWEKNLSMDIIVDCVCFTGYRRTLLEALGSNGIKLVVAGSAKQQREQINRQKKQSSNLVKEDQFRVDEQGCCAVDALRPLSEEEEIYRPQKHTIANKVGYALREMSIKPLSSKLVYFDIFDSIQSRPDLMVGDLSLLFDLLECDVLKPKVSMVVGLEHIARAHNLIENGGLQGSIVLKP